MTENYGLNSHVTFRTEALTKDYVMGETVVHALRGVDIEIPTGDLVIIHPGNNVADGARVVERD